jgi:hypothetical protein
MVMENMLCEKLFGAFVKYVVTPDLIFLYIHARLLQMMFDRLIIYLFTGFVLSGCQKDFDIQADWKDITVVYGILDQGNRVQYIKVNKAFLGEGNNLVYASNPDSNNYPYPLDVWIEEWSVSGDSVSSVYFDTTFGIR